MNEEIKELWIDFEAFIITRAELKVSDILTGKYDHDFGRGISKKWGDEKCLPSFGNLKFKLLPIEVFKQAEKLHTEWYLSLNRRETRQYREVLNKGYGVRGYRFTR